MTELQTIPGIGPAMERDLHGLGFRCVEDLRGQDPEAMYRRSSDIAGVRQDPCVLYVFRCAVYYAETPEPEPELLKWWSWKDRPLRP